MNAVVLENRKVMTFQEKRTPTPRPGHVRLQVRAASICGSDIKRFVSGHRTYPLILGHEVAGVIDQVGEGVSETLAGRRAAVIPLIPCFACPPCWRGHYSACHRYSFIGSRQDGGFADYLELPAANALVVPDDLPYDAAALIEPSTVARHMLALGAFQAGEAAVVLGAGSIGLMIVQWLRILGAGLIVSTDIVEDNLAAARQLGADVTLNPGREDVVAEVRQLTGEGVDIAFEAAGVPQTLTQAVPLTRPRGRVVLGGNQPLDQSLPLSFIEDMMRRELSLIGCFMSYSAPFPGHEWSDTVAALQDGRLDMAAMISHHFSLAEAPAVFSRIGAHELAHRKIILHPEGSGG